MALYMLDEDEKIWKTFYPQIQSKVSFVDKNNTRFVHYTSAEAAASIIKNEEVWMRNAISMNDSSEIEHGRSCLANSYYIGKTGKKLKHIINSIFPNFSDKLEASFQESFKRIFAGTYVISISEHDDSEDQLGRLSMWRAYGGKTGVALVLNRQAFRTPSDALGVHTYPVNYVDNAGFDTDLDTLANNIEQECDFVRKLGEECLLSVLLQRFITFLYCTKHPGFAEEKEWRVVYTPLHNRSAKIKEELETINGRPQIIQKIPLQDIPDENFLGLEIKSLLERIIIGPTDSPTVIRDAFIKLLHSKDIEEPHKKIALSSIPLRH
jgi:hypothetical protein